MKAQVKAREAKGVVTNKKRSEEWGKRILQVMDTDDSQRLDESQVLGILALINQQDPPKPRPTPALAQQQAMRGAGAASVMPAGLSAGSLSTSRSMGLPEFQQFLEQRFVRHPTALLRALFTPTPPLQVRGSSRS